jgi:nitroreductase
MIMESTIKDLKERRSVKSYKSDPVKEEDLKKILEAGMNAPSGRGLQSAKIVVIRNKEVRDKLSRLNAASLPAAHTGDPFYGAPTVLVVLADSTVHTCLEDGCLVMGNLLNAAHALGVGSCWIHRAKEEFETEEGRAMLREWGIGDNYVGIGNCILGYPEGEIPSAKPRKPDYVVWVD